MIGNKGPLNCDVRSFWKALWSYGYIIHPRLYQAEAKWLIRLPHQVRAEQSETFVYFYHLHSFNPQVLMRAPIPFMIK